MWAENPPPLEQTLILPDKEGIALERFGGDLADWLLAEKNRLAGVLHSLFV